MDNTKVKEILGKQLELLAEVSEGKPENLAELSAAMCDITDRLAVVQDPLIRVLGVPETPTDRGRLSETIQGILTRKSSKHSSKQQPDPTSPELKQDEESLRE